MNRYVNSQPNRSCIQDLHKHCYIYMVDIIYIELQRVELLFKAVLTKYIVLQPQKRHIYHGVTSHDLCVFMYLYISFYLVNFCFIQFF